MERAKRLERLWLNYSDYTFLLSYSAFTMSPAALKQVSFIRVHFASDAAEEGAMNEDGIEDTSVKIHPFPWLQNCSASLMELDLYHVTGLISTDFFDCISRCERLEVISLQHVDIDAISFQKLPKENLISLIAVLHSFV
jgi:hypothetical protein